MISPFAFFIICMTVCIFIIYLVFGVIYEMDYTVGTSLEDYVLRSSIWCYLAFYAVTIFVKGSAKSRAYEKGRYGHENARWQLWKCVLAAATAVFAAYGVSRIITATGLNDIYTTYSTSAEVTFADKSPLLLILTTVIAGPVAEELIFRYMTFGRMRCYIGSKWAIILSSLLFGLYHVNLIQFIYCTIIGMFFAAIYDKSGNLWITIGAHMAINLIGIIPYF